MFSIVKYFINQKYLSDVYFNASTCIRTNHLEQAWADFFLFDSGFSCCLFTNPIFYYGNNNTLIYYSSAKFCATNSKLFKNRSHPYYLTPLPGLMQSMFLTVLVLFAFFNVILTVQWFQGAKKVKAQGMGVHSPEEVTKFGQDDLKVLSDMLADKPFFFGDEPTTVSYCGTSNELPVVDTSIDFSWMQSLSQIWLKSTSSTKKLATP